MGQARAIFGTALLTFVFATGSNAQSVISAHSGVIHYVEGDVTINGSPMHPKFAEFPDVKIGQVLATGEGRVEVLLTPGVFLRLAENSSVRMLSNALADTRLELVSGSALVEVGELLEHNAITFDAGSVHMALAKKGLYRIDQDRLRVYDGQAVVTGGSENITAKKGHEIDLASASLADRKFDTKDTDAFYRWGARRAEYVAAANVISARVASNSDYRSGFTGTGGAWSWNPYFGMYTFLPGSGVYWSPFGSAFYSPGVVSMMYIPQQRSAFTGFGAPAGMSSRSVAATPNSGAAPATFGGGRGLSAGGPAHGGMSPGGVSHTPGGHRP